MTCEQARPLLAELAYGDEHPEAATHVRSCARCAAEFLELQGVRRLLKAASARSAPKGHVDVPALYRRAADEQRVAARFWRRAALAAGAVAAGLLLLFALRLELRWHDRELIIGWGAPRSVEQRRPERVRAERPPYGVDAHSRPGGKIGPHAMRDEMNRGARGGREPGAQRVVCPVHTAERREITGNDHPRRHGS